MADVVHPIRAFPEKIQHIINHYSEVKGYPHEYFITAFLAASSTALGRSVVLKTGNYEAVGIIWAAIVGKPGMIKSEAQTDAFKPIKDSQFRYLKDHERELAELEQLKQSNPKIKTELADPKKFLLSDITPEALSMVLSSNPKGCGIVYDELAGFVGRFNRYNSGADEQMFLSLFNGDTILRTRVNGHGNAAIKNSFLTIVGTIQPATLKKVFSDKSDTGFFDRWLISFPDNLKKSYPNSFGVASDTEYKYENIVKRLLQLNYEEFDQKYMLYTTESYKIINEYQCKLIDIQNSTEKDNERSILAKMEIYLHRFALIIQSIIYASGEYSDPTVLNYVSSEAASGAIILTEYYISEANKVRVINPIEFLTPQWKELFNLLPDHGISFTRLEFIKKCAEIGLKTRIADMFLKNNADRSESKLLYKLNQGVYTKNLF